jgi:hypothetical protein
LADAEQIIGRDGAPLATFKANKPSRKVDWEGLALSLLSDYDEMERMARIDAATEIKPGSRVLRLSKDILTQTMEQAA